MKLSLSTRIAESSSRKDVAAIPIEELAPLAADAGFAALSMRASVIDVSSETDRRARVRAVLDSAGLGVSMVMGDVPLAANSPEAPQALRNITPYLDLAEALGGSLVRVMMHHDDDVPHAQRAADEARERGMTLSHQTHWGTLCETVEATLETVGKVGRGNFGVTFEPANLLACGSDYGDDAICRLAPHLVNVYFQNLCIDPDGSHSFKTWTKGPVSVRYLALDDPAGLSAANMVRALSNADYDGWITVHQPLRDGQSVNQAVDEAVGVFAPLVSPA